MLRIPISSLPLRKQKMLSSSLQSPPMFISIEGHHYDKIVNAIIYEVQVGIQNGHDVCTRIIKVRFSDFEKLDKNIRPILNKSQNSVNLPPKKWFGNTNEDFVREREEHLRKYIEETTKNPDILSCKDFLHFFNLYR